LIRNSLLVDSVALMWTQYDLQVIDITSNNNKLNLKNVKEILGFAIRSKNTRLKNFEIALYRTHIIEADKISDLYDLYKRQFPDEFKKIESSNPALYFRLKAYFCEEEKKVDSAAYYFGKAEKLLQSDPNKIHLSNFYIRFGQFLIRHGETKEAIEKFRRSFELASQASYFEYMLMASRQLELVYAGINDFKSAYSCSTMNRVLADSISNMSKKDQLVMLEIDHETRQREIIQQQEEQQRIRRHNIQYTAITIGVFVVFLILVMLGSFRVPEWVIKALGFFSFVFLFEFIVIITDHKIIDITAGEPWKILLIKIILIGFLLPFHQWLEKKVIEYLLNHKLIDISRFSFSQLVRWRTPPHS
jgi:tetratricopeptide (TPR) repeat protein